MNGSKLDQKRNGIKLVLRIFENIVENPNEIKYRNLNANRVFKKLQQCNELRQLLLESGFKTSNDGKRLIFDTTKTININHLKNKLKDHHDDEEVIMMEMENKNRKAMGDIFNAPWKIPKDVDEKNNWHCNKCTLFQTSENIICELCGAQNMNNSHNSHN
eukprot:261865_1